MTDSDTIDAKGDAGTVHKYAEGDDSPTCGTYAPLGPAKTHGAKRRHEVDVSEVDPWNLCEKCYPDRHKDYPENDHWFNVEPAWKWDGHLGNDYTCYVECTHCGWKEPARNKSEAYSMGYEHKRYPDRYEGEDGEEGIISELESASEGDEVRINEGEWKTITSVTNEYEGGLADGYRLVAEGDEEMMIRTHPDNGNVNYRTRSGEGGEVETAEIR